MSINPHRAPIGGASQPRIAFYLRLLHGGGTERVVVNLIQEMVERGIAVDLILNRVSGPFLSQIPAAVQIIDLQADRMLAGLPKLVRYLRQSRPLGLITGLHYNSEIAIWANALAGGVTRVLVTEHNMLSVNSRQCATERWAPLLARWLYPWAYARVAVSQGVAADLRAVARLSPEQIEVIYNPILTANFYRQAQEPVAHPWFGLGQLPVILGIGRLVPQKDFAMLLRAFALVRQRRDCRLVLLGEGWLRSELKALTIQLGVQEDVAFLGFVENPSCYLARADLFVLSSAWEGLANVLVEAIALGVPVVSTDCPAGPREVLAEGRYGQLVPVGDCQAMATAMAAGLDGAKPVVTADWRSQFDRGMVTDRYLSLLGVAPRGTSPPQSGDANQHASLVAFETQNKSNTNS